MLTAHRVSEWPGLSGCPTCLRVRMFWALLVVAVVTSNPPGPIALTGGALSMVVLESMDRGMVGGNGIVVRLL